MMVLGICLALVCHVHVIRAVVWWVYGSHEGKMFSPSLRLRSSCSLLGFVQLSTINPLRCRSRHRLISWFSCWLLPRLAPRRSLSKAAIGQRATTNA
ncbi:hypothetical protein B0T19DRAFT_259885 [Cercophora scortea]|uniref:Secreted protein n=1 Tax=Cercophora scortea TaxID=314031 RepID=A0AAE0I9R1_9PEZI|nr:hypothetical protein B0T19DRAFT_259885 [Cercophora scortea]